MTSWKRPLAPPASIKLFARKPRLTRAKREESCDSPIALFRRRRTRRCVAPRCSSLHGLGPLIWRMLEFPSKPSGEQLAKELWVVSGDPPEITDDAPLAVAIVSDTRGCFPNRPLVVRGYQVPRALLAPAHFLVARLKAARPLPRIARDPAHFPGWTDSPYRTPDEIDKFFLLGDLLF